MSQAHESGGDDTPLHDLTGFQRDVLATISRHDDPHGLGIKQDLEDHYENEINHGRLYPNLDTLVEKGLVDKSERDARTNAYTLTRRGRRELRSHVNWQTSCLEADDE
jgi:DNA-binding PadR family transcriptional regulator